MSGEFSADSFVVHGRLQSPVYKATQSLRVAVQATADLQKLRIAVGNRVVSAAVRTDTLPIPANLEELSPEERLAFHDAESEIAKQEKERDDLIKLISAEYRTLTEGLVKLPTRKHFKPGKYITNYALLTLCDLYETLVEREDKQGSYIKGELEQLPVWTDYLSDVRGIGPILGGILVSTLDPHMARHASSFVKYCGYDVVIGEDGQGVGRSKRKEHMIDRPYISKDGEQLMKRSLTYNPLVKTKLFVAAGSFLKSKSPYATIYYNYKHRLENHPVWKEKTKNHRHRAAMRYMIKIFLQDFWAAWRTIEGLPVSLPYAQAKLGLPPHGDPNLGQ